MTWAAVLVALTAPPLRGSGPCRHPLAGTSSRLLLWPLADKIQTPSGVRAWVGNVNRAPRGAAAGSPRSGAAWLRTATVLLQTPVAPHTSQALLQLWTLCLIMLKGPDTDNPGLEANGGKCAEDQASAGRSWDPSPAPGAGPAAHASLALLTRHKPGRKTGEGSQEASLPGAEEAGGRWGCPWTSRSSWAATLAPASEATLFTHRGQSSDGSRGHQHPSLPQLCQRKTLLALRFSMWAKGFA